MPLIADWLDESKCKRGVTMGMKEKRKGSRRHPGVAEDFLRSKRKIQRRSKVVVSKVKSADFRQWFHREGRDLCTSLNRIITFFSLNDRKSTAAVWRLFIPVFYGVYTSLKNPFIPFVLIALPRLVVFVLLLQGTVSSDMVNTSLSLIVLLVELLLAPFNLSGSIDIGFRCNCLLSLVKFAAFMPIHPGYYYCSS